MELISQLSLVLNKKTFLIKDDVIVEGEIGTEMYHIQNGVVSLIHKKTKSFIKDLREGESFGEIGFFSSKSR